MSRSEAEGGLAGAGKLLLFVAVEELVDKGEAEVILAKDLHSSMTGRVELEQRELFEVVAWVVEINGFMEGLSRGVKAEFVV